LSGILKCQEWEKSKDELMRGKGLGEGGGGERSMMLWKKVAAMVRAGTLLGSSIIIFQQK
jgi:hypothetical protein